jgi:hypothetical protein
MDRREYLCLNMFHAVTGASADSDAGSRHQRATTGIPGQPAKRDQPDG